MQELKLKQVVPESACLACEGCCRFIDPESVFTPHLTGQDIDLLFSAGLARALINRNRFNLVASKSIYCCPCFNDKKNKCNFYYSRPLECELYPFLLAKKNNKAYLALDKKCPFVNSSFIKEKSKYIDYLREILSSKELKRLIRQTEGLLGDYSQDNMIVYIEELSIDL